MPGAELTGAQMNALRGLSIGACLLAAGCSTTSQVDQINAQRAQVAAECQSKGYKPGTQDYYTCAQVAGINQQAVSGVATSAALLPLAFLGAFVSDARLKQDVVRVGRLEEGIDLYRFRYLGGTQEFVGVLAQEVQRVHPNAVVKGSDGHLRVYYDRIGARLMTLADWEATQTAVSRH
jgi:hypothetical protein